MILVKSQMLFVLYLARQNLVAPLHRAGLGKYHWNSHFNFTHSRFLCE